MAAKIWPQARSGQLAKKKDCFKPYLVHLSGGTMTGNNISKAAESLPSPEFWTNLDIHWKCPEILDTFWELVEYHRFVILMQNLSELSRYMYELVLFRASQLFYNLDWKINGEKMYMFNMQSDFIVQKMSRSIGKMKLCGLYRAR